MDVHTDPEATPRPVQSVQDADFTDRTPYIPRRKSSVESRHGSNCQDVKIMAPQQPQKSLCVRSRRQDSVQRSFKPKQDQRLSRASLSKVQSSAETYNDVFSQSHHVLPSHERSSISSSEFRNRRRVFSRLMSSLINNHHPKAVSKLAKSSTEGQDEAPRLSGSTMRDSWSRTSSMASSASTGTSVVRSDLSKTRSARNPNSPNPLWAPPSSALGYRQGTELILAHRRFASNSSAPDDAPAPALATATLHCVSDVTNADLEKPATVWIAIDVECDTYYAENPASSLRSKSLGPPYTDRGYLQKLALDLAPASGCSLLRLVGSENRDVLLPGETWSVVAQVLADPPFRRKQPAKAFSLQNRPSSHALMDQLHTMLSPSGPSSQEMIHVTVSFDHALLPSNVQCSVSENLSLERVSAWSLDSRRQYLRHHRQSTRKSTRASTSDRQRRNDVACKLLDILDWNIQAQAKDIGDREALEILEDFFDGFEGASPRLQTRVKELLRTLEGRIRPVSRAPVSPVKKRRNGMELSRENLELKDITNQQQQQQWSNAAKASAMLRNARDVTTPVPAPLFSPKKRASVANIHHGSGGPSPVRIGVASERIREMRVSSSGVGGPEIGSPRFYEDEVDEANRIWKGMRDSSLGTCSSSRSALGYRAGGVVGRHDGGGEENERSIVGAPWL